jgi:hypothetical protein
MPGHRAGHFCVAALAARLGLAAFRPSARVPKVQPIHASSPNVGLDATPHWRSAESVSKLRSTESAMCGDQPGATDT